MAVYMPADQRRRRTVLVVIAAVVIGLIGGFALGRATSSGVDEAIADAKDKGAAAVTALSRLPIEYEQKKAGTGGETGATLLDSVAAAQAQLEAAFAAAPWLTAEQKRAANAAIASVESAVEDDVAVAEFQDRIDRASAVVARTFGVEANPDIN